MSDNTFTLPVGPWALPSATATLLGNKYATSEPLGITKQIPILASTGNFMRLGLQAQSSLKAPVESEKWHAQALIYKIIAEYTVGSYFRTTLTANELASKITLLEKKVSEIGAKEIAIASRALAIEKRLEYLKLQNETLKQVFEKETPGTSPWSAAAAAVHACQAEEEAAFAEGLDVNNEFHSLKVELYTAEAEKIQATALQSALGIEQAQNQVNATNDNLFLQMSLDLEIGNELFIVSAPIIATRTTLLKSGKSTIFKPPPGTQTFAIYEVPILQTFEGIASCDMPILPAEKATGKINLSVPTGRGSELSEQGSAITVGEIKLAVETFAIRCESEKE